MKYLDARNLRCPLPLLRLKQQLNTMAAAEEIRVDTTDPGSVRDFQAFAKQTGNELLGQSKWGNEFLFFLKRK